MPLRILLWKRGQKGVQKESGEGRSDAKNLIGSPLASKISKRGTDCGWGETPGGAQANFRWENNKTLESKLSIGGSNC